MSSQAAETPTTRCSILVGIAALPALPLTGAVAAIPAASLAVAPTGGGASLPSGRLNSLI
jgi:hypothetical protein